eukprot:jgi/Chlat1/7810/Chrsp66S07262
MAKGGPEYTPLPAAEGRVDTHQGVSNSMADGVIANGGNTTSMHGWRRRWEDALWVYVPALRMVPPFMLQFTGLIMAYPSIADITVAALCPQSNKCPGVLYANGIAATVSGVLAVFLAPLLGALSDVHGRKPILTAAFLLQIIPYVVLAVGRTRSYILAYFAIRALVGGFDGAAFGLIYAYVADVTKAVEQRARVMGMIMAPFSLALLAGTSLAFIVPQRILFQAVIGTCLVAVLILVLFVPESLPRKVQQDHIADVKRPLIRRTTSFRDSAQLVTRTPYLAGLALAVFFAALCETGLVNTINFYMKAQFDWHKNQFATLTFISGFAALPVQLVLLPLMLWLIGAKGVVIVSLLVNALHALLYGLALAPWMPYAAAAMGSMSMLVFPSVGGLVSAAGTPDEQGALQGAISGVKALASSIGPLLFNALTGYFLSDSAPFHCPGFAFYVGTFFALVAAAVVVFLPARDAVHRSSMGQTAARERLKATLARGDEEYGYPPAGPARVSNREDSGRRIVFEGAVKYMGEEAPLLS